MCHGKFQQKYVTKKRYFKWFVIRIIRPSLNPFQINVPHEEIIFVTHMYVQAHTYKYWFSLRHSSYEYQQKKLICQRINYVLYTYYQLIYISLVIFIHGSIANILWSFIDTKFWDFYSYSIMGIFSIFYLLPTLSASLFSCFFLLSYKDSLIINRRHEILAYMQMVELFSTLIDEALIEYMICYLFCRRFRMILQGWINNLHMALNMSYSISAYVFLHIFMKKSDNHCWIICSWHMTFKKIIVVYIEQKL